MPTTLLGTALPFICALALLGCDASLKSTELRPSGELLALPGLLLSQRDEVRDIQACFNQAGEMQVVIQAAIFVGRTSGYRRSALMFWTEDGASAARYRRPGAAHPANAAHTWAVRPWVTAGVVPGPSGLLGEAQVGAVGRF